MAIWSKPSWYPCATYPGSLYICWSFFFIFRRFFHTLYDLLISCLAVSSYPGVFFISCMVFLYPVWSLNILVVSSYPGGWERRRWSVVDNILPARFLKPLLIWMFLMCAESMSTLLSSVLDCKQIHWISRTGGQVHSQAGYFRKTNHSAPGFLNYLAKAFQRLGVQALQSKTPEIFDKQKGTTQTFLKQPAFPVVPTKKKLSRNTHSNCQEWRSETFAVWQRWCELLGTQG